MGQNIGVYIRGSHVFGSSARLFNIPISLMDIVNPDQSSSDVQCCPLKNLSTCEILGGPSSMAHLPSNNIHGSS